MATEPPTRDAQLGWILELAAQNDVKVWLEAGTLLGIIRDGRPLPHDKDLDLAVWAEDVPGLERIGEAAEHSGHRVYRETYRGVIHKMKIFPQGDGRIIDLQVYRRTPTHAWSPARSVPEYTYRWWQLPRVAKAAIRWPLRSWWQERARNVEITRWPWRTIARLWTWWIPLPLVVERAVHDRTGYPIPARWEEYLTHRYGEWRTPDPAWNSERQDPVLRKEAPEVLLEAAAHAARPHT